jgi:uncharacterized protein (TIGR03083 family)
MTIDQTIKTAPRKSLLERDLAMELAAREYDKVTALLEGLNPEQWSAPTDCTGWDVRAMAGHMLGMAQMAASLPEMVRQQRAAAKRQKRDGGLNIDALTAVQVDKNAGLTTAKVVAAMREVGPRAARARRRTPALVRNRTLPEPQDVAGGKESWTLGYLLDTILTRDPFMHRIDICRATDTTLDASADHEGHIVEDVVREWAARHGAPYALELTGPAGGRWEEEEGSGERITMDALEFCRAVGGRASYSGLLAVQVPF